MILRSRISRLAVTLAGTLLAAGCGFEGVSDLPLPGGPDTGESPYRVTVSFRNVLNLAPKSAVKVNDVTVGVVESVERDGWHAIATLRLPENVELPENTTAEISTTSLLGEKFVALAPPRRKAGSDLLADGDHIPLSRTGRNPEVEEVLSALSMLLNGGGLSQMKTINVELHQLMDGREAQIGQVLRRLDTLIGGLDAQRDSIIRSIRGIDRLAHRLNGGKETIRAALDEIGPALRILADQRRDLVQMLDQLSQLGEVGSSVVTRSAEDLVANLKALLPVLTKLVESGDLLPQTLEFMATYPVPDEGLAAIKGDYTDVHVRLDLNLRKLYGSLEEPAPGDDPGLPPVPELPPLPDLPGGLPGLLDALRKSKAPDVPDPGVAIPGQYDSDLGQLLLGVL